MALSKESIEQLEHMSDGLKSGMNKYEAARHSVKEMHKKGYMMSKDKKGKRKWVSVKAGKAPMSKRVSL